MFPSAQQIIDGVESLINEQIDELKMSQTMWRIPQVKKTFHNVLHTITSAIGIHNMDEHFKINETDCQECKDYSLDNPNSKATYLVLFLFTMDMPLRLYLNNAIHRNDESRLE